MWLRARVCRVANGRSGEGAGRTIERTEPTKDTVARTVRPAPKGIAG